MKLLTVLIFSLFFTQNDFERLKTVAPLIKKGIKTEYIRYYEATKKWKNIKKGNEIWSTLSDHEYSFGDTEYNEYDTNGFKSLSLDYTENGEIENTWIWKYNDKGQLTALTWHKGEGDTKVLYQTNRYYYDEQGYNQIDTSFEADGSIFLIDRFYSNNKGLDTLEALTYSDGSFFDKYAISYDDSGRLTSQLFYDRFGKIIGKIKYEYNIKGWDEISTQYEFIEDDSEFEEIYWQLKEKYNTDGEVIKVSEFTQGTYPEKKSTIIKLEFKYEYNSNGDWIKKFVYQKRKLTHIVERELTYY